MPDTDYCSDLHLDFYGNHAFELLNAIQPTSQTLVIAGDLSEARNFDIRWAEILSAKYEHIYYVLGNHEWYGLSFMAHLAKGYKLPANWTLLNQSYAGHFKGCTLWFPDKPEARCQEATWSDFRWIKHLSPHVYVQHEEDKKFLFSEPYTPVWVVHHLPFWQSVHNKYEGASSNPFFVGDISREMWRCDNPPKVIIHGHTHEEFDYDWGGIRVVCNPFGYPPEGRTAIQPRKVEW